MDKPQKRPASYADLSIVQLKTFADRGDERAKEELGKRMGMKPPATSAAAAKQHPSGLQPKAAATPVSRSAPAAAASKPQHLATLNQPVASRGSAASAANTPKTMPLAEMPPEVMAALRRTESMVPSPAQSLQSSSAAMLNNLLINDAPGASGSLSPNLLAKLEEIALNAPDDDEVQPPVYLGAGLMLLGLIVGLFGFSVTKGENATWYFVACGFATALSGFLYFKGKKLALPVYAATCIMAAAWALYESPTIMQAILSMFVPLAIAGYAFHASVRERLEH